MNPKCDLCGREMVEMETHEGKRFWHCFTSPDQHKIAVLERCLESAKKEIKYLTQEVVPVLPDGEPAPCSPDVQRGYKDLEHQLEEAEAVVKIQGDGLVRAETSIAELERQLEEAKAINQNNPSCMMPDGADPCDAYQKLREAQARLAPTSRRLKDGQFAFKDRVAELEAWIAVDEDEWPGGPAEIEAAYLGWKEEAESLKSQLHKAQSERDAALAQVVALRCLIDDFFNYEGGAVDPREDYYLMERAVDALTDTSATAQRVKAEIEREALEAAADRAEKRLRDKGCNEDVSRLRAAILGEKP